MRILWENLVRKGKAEEYVNYLLGELEDGYKVVYEGSNSKYYHQKVFIAFLKELPQEGLDYIMNNLKDKFGDFEGWLEILNGESAIQELFR